MKAMRIVIETEGLERAAEKCDEVNAARARAQRVMELVSVIQGQREFLRGIFLKAGHADDPILKQILELSDAIDLG